MPVRDVSALEVVLAHPFNGYAVRRRALRSVDTNRVAALVAVLGAMVISGVALGRPRAALRG